MIFSVNFLNATNKNLRSYSDKAFDSKNYESLFEKTLDYLLYNNTKNNSVFLKEFIINQDDVSITKLIKFFRNIIDSSFLDELYDSFVNKLKVIVSDIIDEDVKSYIYNIDSNIYYPNSRIVYTNITLDFSPTSLRTELEREIQNINNQNYIIDDKIINRILEKPTNITIDKNMYAEKMYLYFRNNYKFIPPSYLDSKYIHDIYNQIDIYDKYIGSVKRRIDNIKKAINSNTIDSLSNSINNIIKNTIDNKEILKNEIKSLNNIINIFIMFLAVEMDAIIDMQKQNIKIISSLKQ